MRHVLLSFCFAGAVLLNAQQTGTRTYPCEAPAEIQSAITQAGRGGIEVLLQQYRGDFWVQRAYLETAGGAGTPSRSGALIPSGRVDEAIIAKFKSRYDARSEEPEAAFLYAYSLINRDSPKAVEILTSLTEKTPAFPLPWFTLAILHGYPNFGDGAKQRTYIEGFLARCPNTTEPRARSLAMATGVIERPPQSPAAQSPVSDALAFSRAWQDWIKTNRYPAASTTAEARRAYFEKVLQFLDGWLVRSPDNLAIHSQRMSVLIQIPGTPDSALREAGEKMLEVSSGSASMQVAQAWASRGIELERVPALVDEYLQYTRNLLLRATPIRDSDLYAGPATALQARNREWSANTSAWRVLITAYTKTGKTDEARKVLAEWEAGLNERRKLTDESVVRTIQGEESQYHNSFAELALVLPSLLTRPAAGTYSCEVPRQVQAIINRTRSYEAGVPQDEYRKRQQERTKQLAASHPDNLWIQRAYIDSIADRVRTPAPDELVTEFRRGFEARPDNPETAYLFAYVLVGRNTPTAIEILTQLTINAPSFPLPWQTLTQIHSYPAFVDRAKRQAYGEGFLERCPESREAVYLAQQIDKSDKLIAFARAFRARIAGKTDSESAGSYRTLWNLESRLTSPAEFRERVAEDVKFLEPLIARYSELRAVLEDGYKRSGNKEALAKLPVPASPPRMSEAQSYSEARQAWNKSNPPPPPGASAEVRAAHSRVHLQFVDEWLRRRPDDAMLLQERFSDLETVPDTPESALADAGDRLLKAGGSARAIEIARVWAERGIELDRIPALVKEGLEASEKVLEESPGRQSDLLYTADYRKLSDESNRWSANISADRILFAAYSKAGKSAEARRVLGEWESALEERRKRVEELRGRQSSERRPADQVRSLESSMISTLPAHEANYSVARAQFALSESRKLDALQYYQSAIRSLGSRAGADLKRLANDLWQELGGTDEGWREWLRTIPPGNAPVPRGIQTNRAIPDFKLSDIGGNTWTLAGVKGKTTLINVWATWCGPCLAELPHLQKFYERVKDRGDIQVITLNVDEERDRVEPFLKENKYTFPVLFAKEFVDGFAGPIGIPTTWISDAGGVIRITVLGFMGDGAGWEDATLAQMEKVGKGGL